MTTTKGKGNRDAIREAMLNAKPRSKVISIFGQEVELRQSTVGQVMKEVEGPDGETKAIPRDVAFAHLLINHCFVPGTNEKVFDDTDVDVLRTLPFGPELITLQTAIQELMGLNIEAALKNSDGTPSSSASTK